MKVWTSRKCEAAFNMKIQVVVLLLLVTCLSLSAAQGSFGNCCLKYVRKMKSSARRSIQDYRMQETDGDCNIRAVLLLLKRREGELKPVCANPKDKWVKDVMNAVDRRNQIVI
ncbi:C-C motif chemokine 25b [Eucyclogobius newberryi]|uniref:C-C motif chemokine 25b n=1 Tax=Eucyclogobius newberryi TaxID=166745 RepID=UPI003B5A012C